MPQCSRPYLSEPLEERLSDPSGGRLHSHSARLRGSVVLGEGGCGSAGGCARDPRAADASAGAWECGGMADADCGAEAVYLGLLLSLGPPPQWPLSPHCGLFSCGFSGDVPRIVMIIV